MLKCLGLVVDLSVAMDRQGSGRVDFVSWGYQQAYSMERRFASRVDHGPG